jgi:hypothetical protein
MKKIVLMFVASLLLFGCSAHYSDGSRVGVVRKFSKKGVFIKSWEGELLLGGVVQQGTGENATLVNETFNFSIDPEDNNAEKIANLVEVGMDSGKRVKLFYIENTLPKIRTDTGYFIQKAEVLEK